MSTIIGTVGNDSLTGTANPNSISGLNGNDTLVGGDGNDTLFGNASPDNLQGGNGDDQLNGGLGGDALDGGAGNDIADYSTAGAGVGVINGTGSWSGEAGADTLTGIEGIAGSAFNDTLYGNATNETIWGGGGSDTIEGRDGNDTIYGDANPIQTIYNGDFQNTAYGMDNGTAIGWSTTGTGGGITTNNGNDVFALGSNSTAVGQTVSQTLETVNGSVYTLTFTAGGIGGTANLGLSIGGTAQPNIQVATSTNGSMTSYTYTFTATGPTTTLTFTNIDAAGAQDIIIDNVTATTTSIVGGAEFDPVGAWRQFCRCRRGQRYGSRRSWQRHRAGRRRRRLDQRRQRRHHQRRQ